MKYKILSGFNCRLSLNVILSITMLSQEDKEFASEIAKKMVDTLMTNDFREWIAKDGNGGGASGFVTSVAVPMMGLSAIIENLPFSDFF